MKRDMSHDPIQLLKQLIALPSVNPRLTAKSDPNNGESRITAFLQDFAEEQGWPWLRQEVHPGRENFVAAFDIGETELLDLGAGWDCPSSILLEAHQDTVGTMGMTIAPFEGKVQEGKLYGRGACDVKGGMAAMLAALASLRVKPDDYPRVVLLACTINEECGFSGVRALAKIWSDQPTSDLGEVSGTLPLEVLRRLRPETAIVAEPTDLEVVVAHRGVVRWQTTTHGRAAHSSQPERGENAIYAMASVIECVRSYERDVLAHLPKDQRCGGPTVSVTTIQGGTGANTVPESATVNIDRRLSPGETPKAAWQELVDWIAQHADLGGCRIEHAKPWMESHGLAEGENRRLAKRVASVAEEVCGSSKLTGVPYGANAATLAASGIPSVVFGPGSIDQAHTADEWVDVEQLKQATEVYRRLALLNL